jgi:hypothetical protein
LEKVEKVEKSWTTVKVGWKHRILPEQDRFENCELHNEKSVKNLPEFVGCVLFERLLSYEKPPPKQAAQKEELGRKRRIWSEKS